MLCKLAAFPFSCAIRASNFAKPLWPVLPLLLRSKNRRAYVRVPARRGVEKGDFVLMGTGLQSQGNLNAAPGVGAGIGHGCTGGLDSSAINFNCELGPDAARGGA